MNFIISAGLFLMTLGIITHFCWCVLRKKQLNNTISPFNYLLMSGLCFSFAIPFLGMEIPGVKEIVIHPQMGAGITLAILFLWSVLGFFVFPKIAKAIKPGIKIKW
jgi:hypothetical protein